ncbi:MAG: EamA family transporter [Burkholderiaceae bacterium]
MSLEVTLAVLLAALLHASWNAMLKGGSDVLFDTGAIIVGSSVVALPFLFFLPLPAAASWPYLFGSIIVHAGYYYLMINAYRSGELSLVYPLMRGVAPLVTALLGIIWLRELPAALSWIGIVLISIGVVGLALRPADAQQWSSHRLAVGFALANALVIALYTIIDGTGARLAGNPWSYVTWLCVLDGIPFSLYVFATRRRAFVDALYQRRRNGMIGGAFAILAYAIVLWAMTKAPVALVASLRETSVLFATLLGAYLLKERLTLLRWAGVGAVLVGVIALKAA